jgi:hypothetical protein
MANFQSRIGMVHFFEADSMARKMILKAELSWLKILRFLVALRIRACKPNCVNAHSLKFPEKENHYEQHRPRKTQSHGR